MKVQSQDSVVNGKECGCPFTTFTALLASFLSLSYSFCLSLFPDVALVLAVTKDASLDINT